MYEVKCSKCGQIKKFSKERYLKNIRNFGSEEALHQNYVCRNCRTQTYTHGPTPKLKSTLDVFTLAGAVLPKIQDETLKNKLKSVLKEIEHDIKRRR